MGARSVCNEYRRTQRNTSEISRSIGEIHERQSWSIGSTTLYPPAPAPEPPSPAPTPPGPKPPSPPAPSAGQCCYGGCSGNCQGGWCGQSQSQCEGNCNGHWCPKSDEIVV